MVRARGTYEKKEMVSPRYSETYTYEHTVVMTACASFVQAPPRLNLNMEIGGGYEVSPLAKGLLEIDGYWERESVFKGFHLQVNYSPIEYHTFMNIWAAPNGLYGFKQTNNREATNLGVERAGSRRSWGRGKYDQNILYKVVK